MPESELGDLALMAVKPLSPDTWTRIEWLADDETRAAGPGPELSVGWVHACSARDERVREAMLGARPLHIDGIAVLGGPYAFVHDVNEVARIRRFFEAILEASPPPLEAFRAWYPHLHAEQFNFEPQTTPAPGPLAWAYATTLTEARGAIDNIVRILRNAERRRWCVQVCCE